MRQLTNNESLATGLTRGALICGQVKENNTGLHDFTLFETIDRYHRKWREVPGQAMAYTELIRFWNKR